MADININIASPEGVTLATEKTIVNSNIKITIDPSLLGSPIEVYNSSDLDDNSYLAGTVFIYLGESTTTYTHGFYYVKE